MSVTVSTHTQRHVEWLPDGTGRLILLVGYCPDTLAYYQALFRDAKKSVPEIDSAQARCKKVEKSCTVEGFTLMIIPIAGPKRRIERFTPVKWSDLRIEAF